MQPSSSTRATIVSAENQNGATIVMATFFFCHYYIVWESNNAGEARGQSWHESLKSRWIPGGSCGYTSGTKRKHFAALSSPRPCWRWLQLQPSCGSPQWEWYLLCNFFYIQWLQCKFGTQIILDRKVYLRFIFSCDQAALQMVFSVCPSVRPSVCPSVRLSVRLSVCHTFLTMFPSSYHHEIFRSYYQWLK